MFNAMQQVFNRLLQNIRLFHCRIPTFVEASFLGHSLTVYKKQLQLQTSSRNMWLTVINKDIAVVLQSKGSVQPQH